MKQDKYVAYVGTYTHGNSVGIHIYDMDVENGTMTERKVVQINNPSDITVSHNGKFLYSIADEGVEAFKILPDGDLEPLNEMWIGGMRGCYVSLDKEDRFLFVGGYHDGRVTVMKLNEDGSLLKLVDGIFHKGMGNVAGRNYRPHVNCVEITPEQKFLCAVDSGLDHIKLYRIDHKTGKLVLADILRCDLDSAPRMIRFSKDGKFAYVACELKNTVNVYHYDGSGKDPKFDLIQTISTKGNSTSANCAVSGMELSEDGNYLMCTNAGINSVIIYKVDKKSGVLLDLCSAPISGDYPKNLGIYPNNKYLVSLNHETNAMTTFVIDTENKYILAHGKPISVETPTSIYIHKLIS